MSKLAPSKRILFVDCMLVDLVREADAVGSDEIKLTLNDIQHFCEVLRGDEEAIYQATKPR